MEEDNWLGLHNATPDDENNGQLIANFCNVGIFTYYTDYLLPFHLRESCTILFSNQMYLWKWPSSPLPQERKRERKTTESPLILIIST